MEEVDGISGFFGVLSRVEGHKCESSGLTGVVVPHDLDVQNITVRGHEGLQVVFSDFLTEVAHVDHTVGLTGLGHRGGEVRLLDWRLKI